MISRSFADLVSSTGVANATPGNLVMILVGCVLLYLAIVKKFEPLLLLPIGIGAILTNIPVSGIFHSEIWLGPAGLGPGEWGKSDIFQALVEHGGLVDWLYLGVKFGIFPPLIFMGVGAMTDFGPLLANPKTILLGAAAQFGIFATLLGALGLGVNLQEASAIGIIGGADGPAAIFLTSQLADHLMGAIAVSAYSYMALVPIIQPPIMRLVLGHDQTHDRRLDYRDQSHVGVCRNRNGPHQVVCQFGGQEDRRGPVRPTYDPDRARFLEIEPQAEGAQQGGKDAELGSSSQQNRLGIGEKGAKIRHGTHAHEDKWGEDTEFDPQVQPVHQPTVLHQGLEDVGLPPFSRAQSGRTQPYLAVKDTADRDIGQNRPDADGKKQERLKLLDDGEVEQGATDQNHDQVARRCVGHTRGRHQVRK